MEPMAPNMKDDQMTSRIAAAEQLYFSMFPSERPEKFCRFLLFSVFSTVRGDEGITVNKVQWKLNNELSFDKGDVEIAVNALSSQRIFNAISKYQLRRKKGNGERTIIHLRPRKENQELIEAWEEYILNMYPEYKEMTANP